MVLVSGASKETVFLTVDREMGIAELTGAGSVAVVAIVVVASVGGATGTEAGEANVKDGASVGRVAVDKPSSLN